MTDAGFVITGWVLTGFALGAYWVSIVRRTRRARRTLPAGESASPPVDSPPS